MLPSTRGAWTARRGAAVGLLIAAGSVPGKVTPPAAPGAWLGGVARVDAAETCWTGRLCGAGTSIWKAKRTAIEIATASIRRFCSIGLAAVQEGVRVERGGGTGSWPPSHQGWHRAIRPAASIVPRAAPCAAIASSAYSEQDGTKRQSRPRIGRKVQR